MKNKIRQLLRKGVAVAMAAATVMSVLPAATVSAASERATITFEYCYDGAGNTIRYQQTYSHNGITCGHAGEARTVSMQTGRTPSVSSRECPFIQATRYRKMRQTHGML